MLTPKNDLLPRRALAVALAFALSLGGVPASALAEAASEAGVEATAEGPARAGDAAGAEDGNSIGGMSGESEGEGTGIPSFEEGWAQDVHVESGQGKGSSDTRDDADAVAADTDLAWSGIAQAADSTNESATPDGSQPDGPSDSSRLAGEVALPLTSARGEASHAQGTRGSMTLLASAGDPAEAARSHVVSTYVEGTKKLVSNGGNSVSKDGLAYTVGYATSSGSAIDTLRMWTSDDSYVLAYDVEVNPYIQANGGRSSGKFNISSRPDDAAEVKMTMSVFESGVDKTSINDGTATALATFDLTITLLPGPKTYAVSLVPTDSVTGAPIEGASVSVSEGYSWGSEVRPDADGTYALRSDKTYYVKVSAAGYQDYVNDAFTPSASGEARVTLAPIVSDTYAVTAVDAATGARLDAATVTVERSTNGYSYTTVSPREDGTYVLEQGQKYRITATCDGYGRKTETVSVPATGSATERDLTVALDLTSSRVTFVGVRQDGTVDSGAVVTVAHEEEGWDDSGDWGTVSVTDSPNADGSYTLSMSVDYKVSVRAADGSYTASLSYRPKAGCAQETVSVKLYDDPNQARADELAKKIVDGTSYGRLRPHYGTDANVLDMARALLGDLAADDVAVSVASTEDAAHVAQDGAVTYVTDELNSFSGIYVKNVGCAFEVRVADCVAKTDEVTVQVGWDVDFFERQMAAEAARLTESEVKGSNPSLSEVTSNLTLPLYTAQSQSRSYSKVSWTSSDPSVAAVKESQWGLSPFSGLVTRGSQDKTVTLTATFAPNESLLSQADVKADFKPATKVFSVTVKADPAKVQAEKDALAQQLENGFAYANVSHADGSAIAGDGRGLASDVNLPTPGRLGVDGRLYSVTYTSDSDALSINAYRANVVRPLPGSPDAESHVTCTVTSKSNPEVTASKTLPFSVAAVTEAELTSAYRLMQAAKADYGRALASGQDERAVTENLSTFQKAYLDGEGNLAWARDYRTASAHRGIVPRELPGYDDMGGYAQARLFASSDTNVVLNESLQLAWNADRSTMLSQWHERPAHNAYVTVSSVLTDERYERMAERYKSDPVWGARLQMLVDQPVSATLRVLGTTGRDVDRATASVIGRDAFGSPEVWAAESSFDMEGSTTAADLTRRILAGAGLVSDSGEGQWGFYLNSITSPDGARTLGWDAATGRYWQLFVNGEASELGASSVTLSDGDSVVWCYSAYGEELHSADATMVTATVKVVGPDAAGANASWLGQTELSVPAGTTAAALTKTALTRAGYVVDDDIYTIGAAEGRTLPNGGTSLGSSQDASGNWSWWQFFINGVSSEEYANSYVVKSGDQITWYFSQYGSDLPQNEVAVDPSAEHPERDGDWKGFKGNDGTGAVEAPTPTIAADLAWSADLKNAGQKFVNASDVILVDGDVYQAVGDTLLRRDAETGAVKGQATLATSVGYVSRIQYADGLILVPLEGGRLQALVARSLATLWVTDALPDLQKARHQASSAVTVAHGHAYLNTVVPGAGGSVVCVSLASGAVRWVHENAGSGYYWANMACTPAGLLAATEAGTIQAFDVSSGKVLATFELGAGCRGGVVQDGECAYVVTLDGVLHKLSLANGVISEVGSLAFADYSTTTPTIHGGTAYVGGMRFAAAGSGSSSGSGASGLLAAIDVAGMRLLSSVGAIDNGTPLPGDVKSAPLVSKVGDETWVYFTSNGNPGSVYGWRSGSDAAVELYRPDAAQQNYCMASVICDADGNLYYQNDSGTLFKLGSSNVRHGYPKPSAGGGAGAAGVGTAGAGEQDGTGTADAGEQDGAGTAGAGEQDGTGTADAGEQDGAGARSVAPSSNGTKGAPVSQRDGQAANDATGKAPAATTAAATTAKKSDTSETAGAGTEANVAERPLPIWPFAGIGVGAVVLVLALVGQRRREE